MTTRTLYGYRYATIQVGDTLQDIAARELGDASQWASLAWINGLSPPYISGDPSVVSSTVLAWGAQIVLPAPTVSLSSAVDPVRVFGVDVLLQNGFLQTSNGDIALVAGVANLRQALYNRLQTPLRDLSFYPAYGNGAWGIIGMVDGPTASLLAARYTSDSIKNDSRIQAVTKATAQVVGSAIAVSATAQPVIGTSIDLSTEVSA